jgi:hypothetical protein
MRPSVGNVPGEDVKDLRQLLADHLAVPLPTWSGDANMPKLPVPLTMCPLQ